MPTLSSYVCNMLQYVRIAKPDANWSFAKEAVLDMTMIYSNDS